MTYTCADRRVQRGNKKRKRGRKSLLSAFSTERLPGAEGALVTKIRGRNWPSLIEMYSESRMTLSQDLARALFHRENNVIPVTLREREILIGVAPLRGASDAFTTLRFHSSRVFPSFSLVVVQERVRAIAQLPRETGFKGGKKAKKSEIKERGAIQPRYREPCRYSNEMRAALPNARFRRSDPRYPANAQASS